MTGHGGFLELLGAGICCAAMISEVTPANTPRMQRCACGGDTLQPYLAIFILAPPVHAHKNASTSFINSHLHGHKAACAAPVS